MPKVAGWFLVLFLGVATVALADLPGRKSPRPPNEPPRPGPPKVLGNAEMIIRVDPTAKEARLVLPAKLLSKEAAAIPGTGAISNARTIAAGLALSAGMASLLLLKRRRFTGFAGAATACVVAFVVVSAVEGNAAPPPLRPQPLEAESHDPLTTAAIIKELSGELARNVSGQVRIEISNTANVVMLTLPKGAAKDPAAQPKSAPAAATDEKKPE